MTVCDGQECIGKIKVAKHCEVIAFDPSGKGLGRFPSIKAASVAFKTTTERAGVCRE